MRISSFILTGALALAQWSAQAQTPSTTTTGSYTYDLNGQKVSGDQLVQTKSDGAVTTTEQSDSINGRTVPRVKTEERVVSQEGGHTVIERLIRRYSLTGDPGPPEKQVIDEDKRPDGSSTTRTTVYRGDLNGQLQLAERTTIDTRKQGSTVNSDTVVERPTVNGSLDPVERVQSVEQARGTGTQKTSDIYRRDMNGQFYEAVRRVTDQQTNNNVVTENDAEYELGPEGNMRLHSQMVKKSTKNADGSEQEQVDVFAPAVWGTARDPNGALALQEQQTIERRPAGKDTVVETLTVRRPSVSDPTRLGDPRQLSETVCKGKCNAPAQP